MAKVYHKNSPVGGLDYDGESRSVLPTDYRYALNIRNGVAYVRKRSGATFVKGNVKVGNVVFTYGTPTGKSETIGSYEDREDNSIIFFNRNENGQSGIYKYYPNLISAGSPYGEIHQIAFYDFGWDFQTQITSINTISGKSGQLLYWCDNVRGRKINVTKAELVGKLKTWTCYFPKSSTQFQQVFDLVINPMGSFTPIYVQAIDTTGQTQITTIGELWAYLATAINNDPVSSLYVTAEACDCKLNLVEKQANKVDVFFVNQDVKTVPTNWYGLTFTERMFDEAKYPSLLSPTVSFGVNTLKTFNNVRNQVWQFRVNLFYDDFEQSVLSPFTQVPVNELVNDGLQVQNFNYLNINFNDSSIHDNLTLINRMSVTARSGNNGVEQEVAQLEICDFLDYDYSVGRWFCDYDFYNDTVANVIDTAYAAKIQDGVPIKNNAQDIVENRLVKGGILSGEDAIPCLDISVKQEFETGDDEYVTISGQVWIYNPFGYGDTGINHPTKFLGCIYKYPIADPTTPQVYEEYPQFGGVASSHFAGITTSDKEHNMDQFIPLGGFLVYSAGTDFWTVTSQVQERNVGGVINVVNEVPVAYNSVFDGGSINKIEDFLSTSVYVKQVFNLKVRANSKHIIRIASHWCSVGDVLGKGPMYNLNNGREFQTTSTYIRSTNPIDPNTGTFSGERPYIKEIEFEVGNTDVFIGEFTIDDTRAISNTFKYSVNYDGYIVDAFAGTSSSIIQQAPRMEYQAIGFVLNDVINHGIPPNYIQVSDHNGFFYIFNLFENAPFTDSLIQNAATKLFVANKQTGFPFNYYYSTLDSNPYQSDSILRDLVDGNLKSVVAGYFPNSSSISGASYPGSLIPTTNWYHTQLLLYNSSITVSNSSKTNIIGTVEDFSGNKLQGVNVIYTRTGRVSPSSFTGQYNLLLYAAVDDPTALPILPARTTDELIAIYNSSSNGINGNYQLILFPDFITYNGTNPYLNSVPFSLIANYAPFGKALKRGGTYQIGIRYQDEAGRECTVITNQSSIMYIPFITEDLHNYFPAQYPVGTFLFGKPTITLTLNFKPPIWAKSYNIMLTKNQYESSYLQWVANQITYVSSIGYSIAEIAGGNTTITHTTTSGQGVTTSNAVTTPTTNYNPPVVSSFQAGDATNIYISISNLVDYKNSNPDSILAYSYQAGDRLRLIGDQNGNKYNQLYELEVTGYDTTQNAIIVRNSLSVPQLFAGCLFEVLHPRFKTGQDEQIFYEVGESFLCTAPNQPNNDHSVNPIKLTCGDTYWRRRQYLINDTVDFIFQSTSYLIEDANLSDFFVSDSWDIGRAGVFDPFFKQTYKDTDIIVSNPYSTDSNLNGFNSFEALNSTRLDKNYGPIQRLIMIGNVLHVICENKSVSDYIGQRVLSESKALDGPVAIASTFLGTSRAQIKDIGTQHPASVSVKDGYIYGLDARRAIVWRDANDGMTEISKAHNEKGQTTMMSFFKDLCSFPLWSVTSGVDKYYNEYILTVYQEAVVEVTNINGQSYSFPPNEPQYPISVGDTVYVQYIDSVTGLLTNKELIVEAINANYITFDQTLNTSAQQQVTLYYRNPNGITIAWAEDKNRWSTFYSFLPESYGKLGALLYSYKGGELWVHDENEVRNNFYGVQYPSVVTPVLNNQGDLIKVWQSLGLESIQDNGGFEWSAELSNDYNQQSKLVPQNFYKKERQYYADCKRDETDVSVTYPLVNGRVMRSESLEVKLTSTYNGDIILRLINALSILSMRTGA